MTAGTAGTAVIPVMKPWLGVEEQEAAAAAVASGWVAQGPRVAAFEEAFAQRVGAAAGVATSSCTTALHLALIAAGVGPGDDVLVPSLSFIATANVVLHAGANPVFADVDLATQNVTPAKLDAARTPATRAVIAVHQAGMPADMAAIDAWAAGHGIRVVEDAACAIGSTTRGKPVGAGAALAAFSFHPRKVITTGEGGMLTFDDADRAPAVRRLREHGMSVSAVARHQQKGPVLEQYLEVAFNYRMTDIQAAIGLVQLNRLDAIVERRRALAARYDERLRDLPGLATPQDPPYGTTNHQSYWVVLPEGAPPRDDVLAALAERGVSARRGIMASHLEPAYAEHPCAPLPVTEHLTRRSLILPLYHELAEGDQDRVVEALSGAVGG